MYIIIAICGGYYKLKH